MTRFGEAAVELGRAAAMLLGWRPSDFWDATPSELASALSPPGAGEPPERNEIDALMQRFPDETR